MLRATAILSCCFLFSAAMARADEYSKKTVVTLHEPVIVAGVEQVTLQPGVYVIKLLNHDHNRNIVQFYNEDQNQLFATVMAINNYRLVPHDKTVLTFWETPSGNPPALKAWFPAGEQWGQEFVYPKGLALKIAKEARSNVLTAPVAEPAEMLTEPVAEVEPSGEEIPLEAAFIPPPIREPEVTVAEPEPLPESAPAEPLPATASPIYTIGLAGLVAASMGLLLRKFA